MAGPVLIVNTDAATLAEQLVAFQRADYAVVGASSFGEARALLMRMRPGLLVTALRMGEFNGLHLAILARLKHGPLPTIVIGEADSVLEREAERVGAQFVLSPASPGELVAIARRAMGGEALPRRWRRIRPDGAVEAVAAGRTCEVVDLSYGGIGLTLGDAAHSLPDSFDVDLPSYGVRIHGERVWQRDDAGHLRCGVAVPPAGADVPKQWRFVVDLMRGDGAARN